MFSKSVAILGDKRIEKLINEGVSRNGVTPKILFFGKDAAVFEFVDS